ncbi:hypothetical protein GIB67_036739 [Kingdonia uniflora]|uniref:V-SNARE coiled-coil homology domain-containing protein n=1 Tax=Kingdonia uniflora TaxID=39325 RepID=A0A7J7LWW0_9MAGN|nr:hypothetical protein GIB67_036739 [Kingdonia uniflora]
MGSADPHWLSSSSAPGCSYGALFGWSEIPLLNIPAVKLLNSELIVYTGDENGLMSVLKYDAEEGKLSQLPYHIPANSLSAQVVLVRGYKDLQLKDGGIINPLSGDPDDISDQDQEQEEKEISSLCWASSSGSILAVGYIDGDIILWNMSSSSSTKGQQAGVSPNNVVKLELSSAKRRLPVIILHWSANSRSRNDRSGQLFVYGGDEIGSEEVLTILSLEWSSGIETLRCVNRVDLTLNGSFADMILISNVGATENNPNDTLFVLTNPGHLDVYDDAILSTLSTPQEKKPSVSPMQFPVVIPAVDPDMTVAKLCTLPIGGISSKALLEVTPVMRKSASSTLAASSKWHLTGGVPSQLSVSGDQAVEQVYIAGYQDGSVRMWDATNPILSLIFVLPSKVQNIEVIDASASVSALDFYSQTTSLAVGNQSGLVRIYKLSGTSSETSIHFVTETKNEVHTGHQEKGLQCIAVLSYLDSPIISLQYTNFGTKLAIGFNCGRVAMLDMSSLSILFLTDCLSGLSSPVISITWKANTDIDGLIGSLKHQGATGNSNGTADALFVLTRDSHITVIDGVTECSNTVSEVSIENKPEMLTQGSATLKNPGEISSSSGVESQKVEVHTSSETTTSGNQSPGSLMLLCCEDSIRLFSLKSVLQGENNSIHKVILAKPCCWTTIFKKKDDKTCGLVLLYQTGIIEIRSLPDLEVVGESSLMSILRWSFKANMQRTASCTDYGLIALVNGCELAFVSLLACENEFRIPESLPCLHDKVLAAAADAAISFSSNQKKKQGTGPGILGGIIKGFKADKAAHSTEFTESVTKPNCVPHLEKIFSKVPFSDPSGTVADDQGVVHLSIGLISLSLSLTHTHTHVCPSLTVLSFNIDDIQIDEPIHVTATSTHKGKTDKKDRETEREKLFQGATADTKPRLRTPEEIMAKYRKAGDASAIASQARNKLVQRQEKLERISRNTEELQNGAENFASMANELVKTMEARKWWNI